jgi:hypothetical protein
MIGVKARVSFNKQAVINAARKGSFKSLAHAAAAIRQTAQRSIKDGKTPSPPGQPPHTRGHARSAAAAKCDSIRRR